MATLYYKPCTPQINHVQTIHVKPGGVSESRYVKVIEKKKHSAENPISLMLKHLALLEAAPAGDDFLPPTSIAIHQMRSHMILMAARKIDFPNAKVRGDGQGGVEIVCKNKSKKLLLAVRWVDDKKPPYSYLYWSTPESYDSHDDVDIMKVAELIEWLKAA